MVEIMTEHPLVDEDGYLHYDLIKHYGRDEKGVKYTLIQNETGEPYEDPVDLFPCKYTYSVGEKVEEDDDIAKDNVDFVE
jgi:hypothetical protein